MQNDGTRLTVSGSVTALVWGGGVILEASADEAVCLTLKARLIKGVLHVLDYGIVHFRFLCRACKLSFLDTDKEATVPGEFFDCY